MTPEARQLAEQNVRLVGAALRRFKPLLRPGVGIEAADLLSAGYLGLCQAAEKWNPNLAKFSTYAINCIRREMIEELRRATRRTRGETPLNEGLLDVPDTRQPVEAQAVNAQYADWLLSLLPRRHSDLMVSLYWIGLREIEQAQQDGRSRQAVYNQRFRALRMLRERLAEGE